ncbi:hypothetical protein HX088_01880 [Empedobacter sp. 225-1]|uniref:hypothetical protein n=1 Tax=Empedobacter sp. 225-1 TaxID=2746725 RepID=UPI0025781306|nr:hypothetical protein [Empedobacter sp. 225-1]MDM1522030.1 hypothetical protein [Empedobacter sp. 225-1]
MDLLPKFLKDIIDNFNLEQVVLWIKEIFIFLFKPQKFVTLFYQQSIKKTDKSINILYRVEC